MSEESMLSGTELQARKMKETDEERAFYRDYTAMYDLNSMKTAFNGYDKKEVRKYLQKILEEHSEQEKSTNKIIDDLRNQIAVLKKDKDESVQKYNRLLLAKIGGTDTSASANSSEEVNRLKKESEDLQKKVLVLSGQLSSLKEEKAKNDEKIAGLQAESENLRAQNEQLTANSLENATIADAKKLFEGQMKILTEQKDKLEAENKRISAALADCETSRNELKKQLSAIKPVLEETRQKLQSRTEELENTKKENEQSLNSLQSQLEELTRKNTELESLSSYAKDMKEALVRSAASEKAALQAKKALEGKARALALKNESLTKEVSQLQDSYSQTQSALTEAKNYAAKLEGELSTIYEDQLGEDVLSPRTDEAAAAEQPETAEVQEQKGA